MRWLVLGILFIINVRLGSPEKQTQQGVGEERNFKKLTHQIIRADKFKLCRVGRHAQDPGTATVAVQV